MFRTANCKPASYSCAVFVTNHNKKANKACVCWWLGFRAYTRAGGNNANLEASLRLKSSKTWVYIFIVIAGVECPTRA